MKLLATILLPLGMFVSVSECVIVNQKVCKQLAKELANKLEHLNGLTVLSVFLCELEGDPPNRHYVFTAKYGGFRGNYVCMAITVEIKPNRELKILGGDLDN